MKQIGAYLLQAVIWAVFAVTLGLFSVWPIYQHFPSDRAMIKLSFNHGGQKKGCRNRTQEEIAKLSPQMRTKQVCDRARTPVTVEMSLDGKAILAEVLPPRGLSGDSQSMIYRRIPVPPGPHVLELRLRDSPRETGWDFERRVEIALEPGRNLAVDFRKEFGGFILR